MSLLIMIAPARAQSDVPGGPEAANRNRQQFSAGPGTRPSLASWQALHGSKNEEVQGGFAHVGPVSITLGLSSLFEYNSNVNGSGSDPIWDISITPQFSIALDWPITRQNELHFQLGLEYQKYLVHPDLDRNNFSIDPGTILEYRVFTGDFVISVYDSPQISNDPGNEPGMFNTVNFSQLQNAAGISVIWDLNKLVTTVGFERVDTRSLSGTYTSSDGTMYSLSARSIYSITPTTGVGMRTGVTKNDYTSNTLNDYTSALAGVILSSRLSPYTSYSIEVGLQGAKFSDNGNQTGQLEFSQADGFNDNVDGTLGGGDYLQPYFSVQIDNRLTRYYSQALIVSREAQGSSISNYQESNSIAYNGQLRLNAFTRATFTTTYQIGTVSAKTDPIPYYTWQNSLRLGFDIARDIGLTFSYDYLVNDLDVENGSYDRHRIGVAVSWTF